MLILVKCFHCCSLFCSEEVLNARPPWLPPDRYPQDIELSCKALLAEFNPNDPEVSSSLMLHHNKWGISKNSLRRSHPEFSSNGFQLKLTANTMEHPFLTVNSCFIKF